MPTATDGKLAEQIHEPDGKLASLRVEMIERFASVEKDIAGFRSGVETELRIIRNLGKWLLGGVFGVVAAMITGAATIAWSASAVVSEIKHQGERLEKVEKQQDVSSRQTGPKTPQPKADGNGA